MRRVWREGIRMAVLIMATVSLGWTPAVAEGQPPRAPSDLTVADAPASGAGSETAPTANAGSGAGGRTGESVAEVGRRLHDGAKNFGEAILDGIQYVERTVAGFFTGNKSR